jgi:hypothetical protein
MSASLWSDRIDPDWRIPCDSSSELVPLPPVRRGKCDEIFILERARLLRSGYA